MDRIFQINSFNWGESDDLVQWPANSFYSWENIEVRKNLTALQLTPALVDTGWVFDDDITLMVNLQEYGVESWGILVCLENWKVFLDWVLKNTFSTGTTAQDRVYWIWVNENLIWTQYIYYITGTSFWTGKIHRSTNDLATFNESYREFRTNTNATSNSFVWTINDAGFLYIAKNNKIFLLESDEIVQEYLIIPAQEEITWFTQFQGSYKIYANAINTWVQYVWDWVSEAASYRQEWINQPILWVVNDGAYDYAILWFNQNYSDLYQIAGTQKTELRVNLESATYSRVLDKYLSIREGLVYISWGLTWESSNYWIYTYWNYYPWANRSLVQSFSGTTNQFLHHCHKRITSYFSSDDNKVYTVDNNNPPNVYADSWYVVTNIYQWFLWEEKAFNYMKLGFKLNWWEIRVYARTSMDLTSATAYTLIKTIDNATYWDKKYVRIDKNELMSNWASLGTFNELQFKFELIPNPAKTKTPELYQPTTWLTVINNK